MATFFIFFLLIWNCLIEGAESAEYCFSWVHVRTYYCEWGCCGDDLNKYCCAYSLVGLIAGICVGVVALIVIIVVAIVVYMKQRGHSGRIVGPTQQTTVAVLSRPSQQNYPANPTQTGNSYPTNQTQTVVSNVRVQSYPAGSYPQGAYGQTYTQTAYGQVYPPPAYGQQYPPTAPVTHNTGPTLFPHVEQTSSQGQYPPGSPPGASIYNNSEAEQKNR